MEMYKHIKNRNKVDYRASFFMGDSRGFNKRPLSGRSSLSFSSLKHRREYKNFSESKKMADVLKHTRNEAVITGLFS